MPPSTVNAPIDTIAVGGRWNRVLFEGMGLQLGDHVRWVPLSNLADGCVGRGFTFGTINAFAPDGRPQGDFRFEALGGYFLCYRFLYKQMTPRPPPSGWVIYPHIRAVAIASPLSSPNGTAVGCVSNVSVATEGIYALSNLSTMPLLECTYTTSSDDVISTDVTTLSDSLLSCLTPEYTAPNLVSLALRVGTLGSIAMEPAFLIYDSDTIAVATVYPRGGWFNYDYNALLTGSFINAGDVRCRFGENPWGVSSWAVVFNRTHMRCEKPAFPDETRDSMAPLTMYVAPNGQCYKKSERRFVIYNSLITEINPIGAPSIAKATVDVIGDGFPYPGLPGAKCIFTQRLNATAGNATGPAHATPLAVRSSTLASCASPAAGIVGAQFDVAISLNGEGVEPLKFPDQPLTFTEYDLSAVHVSHLEPPGGPVNEATSLTLFGSSFASYGSGQVQVKATSDAGGGEEAFVVPGRVLDSERVLCTLPAFASPRSFRVQLSLSGGSNGTYTDSAPIPFGVYHQPVVLRVEPSEGDANGGSIVSIHGLGFTALNDDYLVQRRALRCSFGGTVHPMQPKFHNDTFVLCVTTWGSETPEGLKVGVALNGEAFATNEEVRFRFFGLYQPNVVDVYFPPEATSLIIQFDDQPTNRAGMSGLAECSLLLEASTIAILQGSDPESPKCFWTDDSTVTVFLTTYTYAAPGMNVQIRSSVLWPKLWAQGGLPEPCKLENNLCNLNLEMTVDKYFPCNLRATPEREEW